MQRRGVASLRVAAVNVVGAAQLLHPGQAALLGGVQQGGVPAQQVLDVGVSVFDQVQRRVPVSVLLGGVGAVLQEEKSTRRHRDETSNPGQSGGGQGAARAGSSPRLRFNLSDQVPVVHLSVPNGNDVHTPLNRNTDWEMTKASQKPVNNLERTA